MQARPCRSCGVMVYDLRHPRTGKIAPIEVATSEKGNVRIDLSSGFYYIITQRQENLFGNEELRLNHFVTCPAASSWGHK